MENLKTLRIWESTHTRLRLLSTLSHGSLIETLDRLTIQELEERIPDPEGIIKNARGSATYRDRSKNANTLEAQEDRILARIDRFYEQFKFYPTEREIQWGVRLPRYVISSWVVDRSDNPTFSCNPYIRQFPAWQRAGFANIPLVWYTALCRGCGKVTHAS